MCTMAITIQQVLDPSRLIYQGPLLGPAKFDNPRTVKVHWEVGTWPPWSTLTDAAGLSWLMIVTVCNKKATVTASILTPKLHPENSSEYTKQMAVYCADCQYSVSELLKSTCPQTRCEFEELTSGGATVALSIIATATLKESVTMTPINTLTLHTACAAWAAWRALRERTGQNRWHVRLGIKPLQRPHCKPGLKIRSIVENKQAFKDTGKPCIKILQRNSTANIWHVSNTCQSALGICARSFLACMSP